MRCAFGVMGIVWVTADEISVDNDGGDVLEKDSIGSWFVCLGFEAIHSRMKFRWIDRTLRREERTVKNRYGFVGSPSVSDEMKV